jgi:cyclophilin family peptidyl-prolyl cis-trans isomerase
MLMLTALLLIASSHHVHALLPAHPTQRLSLSKSRCRQRHGFSLIADRRFAINPLLSCSDDPDVTMDTNHKFSLQLPDESLHNEHLHAPPASSAKTRRQFLNTQLLTTAITSTLPSISSASETSTYFSLTNNNNVPISTSRQPKPTRQSQKEAKQLAERQQKASSAANTKKWIPFSNINKWDTIETYLLELLPVKNSVFRRLQEFIENLTVHESNDSEGWKQTVLDTLTTLSLLESKRSSLEPVFNQEDPTALFISKSSIGERNIETLRGILEQLVKIASGGADLDIIERPTKGSVSFIPSSNFAAENLPSIDVQAFENKKKQALFALAEVGELLVPSFPYAVPTRGKFAYLPRLLGRCTVTFTFERPSSSSPIMAFGLFNDASEESKRILGNVTIVADGYAAPITAGNFVDLSMRNFYTGLPVKAIRKRLGVVPSWSDNVIVNDLTELKDNLDVLADDFGSDLTNAERKLGFFQTKESLEQSFGFDGEDSRMTMDAVMPILGSFQEGFYDPLTAKPRRIPLELVALDPSSPRKATLTYSSSFASLDSDVAATTKTSVVASSSSPQRSFSSATSETSSNTTTTATGSNLNPVLSFDVPNIVALNHPDRVSNGGSSEFFALPTRDISPKRTKLLNGQYAPFGYIVGGSDVYNSLRPGDVIKATYVSELGQLNLVKIRKNAFEGGEEEEEVIVEEASEEKESQVLS